MFALALRNLTRHSVLNALAGAAIALVLSLTVASNNLSYGIHEDMIRTSVGTLAGHVVVQHKDRLEEPEAADPVHGSGAVEATLEALFPDALVLRRIFTQGLLTSPSGAGSVALTAAVPSEQNRVDTLHERLTQGEWVADDDGRGIVIGEGLARQLDVELGDKVVFVGQVDGEVTSRLFRVRGLFRTGNADVDSFQAVCTLAAGQELLGGDDPATVVAVQLPHDAATSAARDRARAALPDPALAVLSWEQALPDVVQFIQVDAVSSDVTWAFLAVISVLVVLNVVLMAVMGRFREMGMMMAVGMRPGQVARLVLIEYATLGVISAGVGLVLGGLLTWHWMVNGLDLSGLLGGASSYDMGGVLVDTVMYAELDPVRTWAYPLAGVVVCVASAAWPAWRIARMSPLEAMRS